MEMLKTISEAADATGLSEDTLRYYERIGVIGEVERNASGHRRYSDMVLGWLGLVVKLRATGMSLEAIQHYAEMQRKGNETIALRREILVQHQQQIAREVERLTEVIGMLQAKIDKYDRAIEMGAELPIGPCHRL